VFGSRKASLLEIWLLLLTFSSALFLPDPGRQWVAALKWEGATCQLGVNPNGTPPKVIPGQKLNQALKQHRQLALLISPKETKPFS